LNPRQDEAQLEDQKSKKAQESHLEEGKKCKTNKWQEKRQTKEKLKLKTP
jgi:hypothetical protein